MLEPSCRLLKDMAVCVNSGWLLLDLPKNLPAVCLMVLLVRLTVTVKVELDSLRLRPCKVEWCCKMTKLFLLFFLLSLWALERERREGRAYFVPLKQCFSTYSSRGTFKPLLNVWRNLDTWNRADFRIPKEPSKEFAEPRLKNTALEQRFSNDGSRPGNG